MKRIRNNKEIKPKWINLKIKRVIRETKIAYQIQKTNSSKKISRYIGNFYKARKGKLGKVRDYAK